MPGALCPGCNQDMSHADSCTLDGGRVRWGSEEHRGLRLQFEAVDQSGGGPSVMRWMLPEGERDRDPTWEEVLAFVREPRRCPDCNVAHGGLHHPGCDTEECPDCHLQAIGCECGGFERALDRADAEPHPATRNGGFS